MKMPEIVSVKLTVPECDVILQSMGQQPYDRVADLIANIRAQVLEQINQHNAPKPVDTDPQIGSGEAGGTD